MHNFVIMSNINSTAKLNLKNNILIPKFRDLMKQTHWPIYAVEEKIKSDKADQHPPVNTAGSPPEHHNCAPETVEPNRIR